MKFMPRARISNRLPIWPKMNSFLRHRGRRSMAGYERWQKATGNLMRPLIETRFTGPADTHAFGEALMDELLDGKPVKPQGPPLTPEESFRNRLMRAWMEVDTSVEALKDI